MGVLPASAGMILGISVLRRQLDGVPRIREDDPLWVDGSNGMAWCSPHPRG